jgi:hypothetical protein
MRRPWGGRPGTAWNLRRGSAVVTLLGRGERRGAVKSAVDEHRAEALPHGAEGTECGQELFLVVGGVGHRGAAHQPALDSRRPLAPCRFVERRLRFSSRGSRVRCSCMDPWPVGLPAGTWGPRPRGFWPVPFCRSSRARGWASKVASSSRCRSLARAWMTAVAARSFSIRSRRRAISPGTGPTRPPAAPCRRRPPWPATRRFAPLKSTLCRCAGPWLSALCLLALARILVPSSARVPSPTRSTRRRAPTSST